MKKLFSLLAIGAIVLGMASCGDGNSPEVIKGIAGEYVEGDFKIEMTDLTQTTYSFYISADEVINYKAGYFYTYFSAYSYRELYEELGDDPKAFVDAVIKIYLEDFKAEGYVFEKHAYHKPLYDGDEDLTPGSVHFILVFRYDENYKLVGKMSYRKVTLPGPDITHTIHLNLTNALYEWFPLEEDGYGILYLRGKDEQKNIGMNVKLSARVEGPDRLYISDDLWSGYTCRVFNATTRESSVINTIYLKGTENPTEKTFTFSGEITTDDNVRFTFSDVKATFSDKYASELYEEEGQ